MIRVAYLCEPQVGGTYTFFDRLQAPLAKEGVDLVCLPPCPGALFKDTRYASRPGIAYLDLPDEPEARVKYLVDYLAAEQFDAVITIPIPEPVTLNLNHFLPPPIRRLVYLPTITSGMGRLAATMLPHVDAFVSVCEAASRRLLAHGKPCPKAIHLIPSVAPEVESIPLPSRRSDEGLNLLYVGRLVDEEKGIFLLPDILKSLISRGRTLHLSIVGGGPDGEELKRRFAASGVLDHVHFLGSMLPEKVLGLYGKHHVLLMPSRFEGSPFALLEAMAFGCVPVVTFVPGATEDLVQHNQTGFLVMKRSVAGFSLCLDQLYQDRELLNRMSRAAAQAVEENYSPKVVARQMKAVLDGVLGHPREDASPWSNSHPLILPSRVSGWRRWIPAGVKKYLRTIWFRFKS